MNQCFAPWAIFELQDVTGIAKEGNTANIEFTWRWKRTAVSEVTWMPPGIEEGNRTSNVGAQLYDDGWRIGTLELH